MRTKTRLNFFGWLTVVQVALLLARMLGVIGWPWWAVFLPFLALFGVMAALVLFVAVVVIVVRDEAKRNRILGS